MPKKNALAYVTTNMNVHGPFRLCKKDSSVQSTTCIVSTTRLRQSSYWHQQNTFCCIFCALHTHTSDNGVSCIWSAAKGTLWYFSSLNSLFHKIFVAKTEKNCLSRAGSETLLDGVLHCYLFLTPTMFGSSNTTNHSYFIPYLKSYLRIIQRCPFIQSPVLQPQG